MSLTENPIDSSQATTTGSVDPVGTLFWIELVCATCKATAAGCWAARQIPVRQIKRCQGRRMGFLGKACVLLYKMLTTAFKQNVRQ